MEWGAEGATDAAAGRVGVVDIPEVEEVIPAAVIPGADLEDSVSKDNSQLMT